MKKTIILLLLIFLVHNGWTDIAPNPIVLKSIMATQPCEVQMVSEAVDIDLYPDSSFVSCTFNMMNHGDSLTLDVGFPVMNFFHWNMFPYDKQDKERFEIYVDNVKLDENDVQVPENLKDLYDKYMHVIHIEQEYSRKLDSVNNKFGAIERRNRTKVTKGSSLAYERARAKVSSWRQMQPYLDGELIGGFDSLLIERNYPWYIWKVRFQRGESRLIKVKYTVPSGLAYGGEYRYMKYLLSTGAGWKDKIAKAEITVRLNDIKLGTLETINPADYKRNKRTKTITWTLIDLEPTETNDIYVRYFIPSERSRWENFKEKRSRQLNTSN